MTLVRRIVGGRYRNQCDRGPGGCGVGSTAWWVLRLQPAGSPRKPGPAMADFKDLVSRIDAEFSALGEKHKKAQAEQVSR